MRDAISNDRTLLGPYRVLDLADEKGTLCGQILASMGADVIKIEPPEGCPARRRGPFYHDVPDSERSLVWWALEANKRSVTLNLENADGRAIFLRLVETADFLVESFSPDYLDTLGLGYEELHKVNPALVFVSISPYGRTGPHSTWAATDLNVQATSGHMYLNGEPDRSPVRLGVSATYWHGGAEAAQAAMIANHYRRRTGRGQRVDVSLQQCHIWTLLNTTMTWQLVRRQEIRGGARRKERGNNYYSRHLWPCKDGAVHFIPIGGGGGKSRQISYARLMEIMKADGFYDDFLDARDWNGKDIYVFTQAEYDKVAERIAEYLMTKTVAELYELAIRERFLLAPLNTVKDLLENTQLREREFFVEVQHPELGTAVTYAGPFAKFSRTPLEKPRPAPRLGEHNAEILGGELGFTTQQLGLLRTTGAI